MTEQSMLWTTNGVGHGAAPYTREQANEFFRDFTITDPATMGPLKGIDNELVVSGTSSPLAVATGKAVVYGYRYWNDASKNVTVATPAAGDTGGRIVLRANWASQLITAVVKLGNDGVPTIPSLVQSALTTWEISLASFVIDTSGNIWTNSSKSVAGVTDTRIFATTPLADRVPAIRQGGDATEWATVGATDFLVSGAIVQVGRASYSGAGISSGIVPITWPIPFAASAIMLANADDLDIIAYGTYINTTTGTISWKTIDASTRTSVLLTWMALGVA
jgi:hypothetical protein